MSLEETFLNVQIIQLNSEIYFNLSELITPDTPRLKPHIKFIPRFHLIKTALHVSKVLLKFTNKVSQLSNSKLKLLSITN